ncbi:MAG: DUF4266 domain-containing protein [Gammaproteobacteria bacterium]
MRRVARLECAARRACRSTHGQQPLRDMEVPVRCLRRLARWTLLALVLLLAACAEVRPWERGVLAKPHMAWDAGPLSGALEAHVYGSREAAAAAAAAAGGGCGCY